MIERKREYEGGKKKGGKERWEERERERGRGRKINQLLNCKENSKCVI